MVGGAGYGRLAEDGGWSLWEMISDLGSRDCEEVVVHVMGDGDDLVVPVLVVSEEAGGVVNDGSVSISSGRGNTENRWKKCEQLSLTRHIRVYPQPSIQLWTKGGYQRTYL